MLIIIQMKLLQPHVVFWEIIGYIEKKENVSESKYLVSAFKHTTGLTRNI